MFTQLVLILISGRDSSLWVPGAVAKPRGYPVDLVCTRSHNKPLGGNIYRRLPILDILLKSQSCHGNMIVLTGVTEHKARREPPCLHGNRGNTTMVLGCPGK